MFETVLPFKFAVTPYIIILVGGSYRSCVEAIASYESLRTKDIRSVNASIDIERLQGPDLEWLASWG